MTDWTVEQVAERFQEAAETARRLPPVHVQGYFNLWPPIQRQPWEGWDASDNELRPLPPAPDAIERLEETQRWVQWLSVEERHLVWMKASDIGWKVIARRFGCDRTTAWRRWQRALGTVVHRLNGTPQPPLVSTWQWV